MQIPSRGFRTTFGRLLQERLTIKVSGEVVYDNTGESVLGVYRDLWLKSAVRNNMVEDDVANVSKDDVANDDAQAAVEVEIYGTRQRIRLGQILKDHGLYTAFNLPHSFQYVITLPKATDIMVAQTGEKVAGYTLRKSAARI